jgi:glycosyltransferase involved in cell wall biosynthesis
MKIALVHDYITQFGGAEQVLAVLAQMYPDAPVLTSLHDPAITLPNVSAKRIHESALGRVPWIRQRHRIGTPVFPLAMRSLASGTRDADVIIADSSAWSHHIPVHDGQGLIVYCHSPARFLYGDSDYLGATNISGTKAHVLHAGFAPFRYLDRRAWMRADLVLANSSVVARRLRDSIGIAADVVYPPVDVDYFRPPSSLQRDDNLLVVSRLVAHKRVELAIQLANRYQIPLKIIGTGRDRERLESMAGPSVAFLGFQPRESVRHHLQRSAAFVLPGAEDFGMTSVEAQAAGVPVLAFDRGGATESVLHGVTGFLFKEQTVECLYEAVEWVQNAEMDSEACIANAARFGIERFQEQIRAAVGVTAQSRGTG